MDSEIWGNINWTVVWSIFAFTVPVCLTFFGLWIKNYSSPSEIKKLKQEVDDFKLEIDDCHEDIVIKIDSLVNSIQNLSNDFDKKLNGFRKNLEDKHYGDHDEIIEKINNAKADLAKLNADIMVLQTNQANNEKTLDEIKEDYKNVTKRLESIVDKMIAYMSAND
jgi:chromosome segregation ATPase